jgi:hypothetical protein
MGPGIFLAAAPSAPTPALPAVRDARRERTDRSSCNGEVATAIPASVDTTGIHRADALPAPRTVDRLQAAAKPLSMTTPRVLVRRSLPLLLWYSKTVDSRRRVGMVPSRRFPSRRFLDSSRRFPSRRLLLFVLLLALNRGSLAIVGGCVPWLSPRSDLRDSTKPRSPRKVTEGLHDALHALHATLLTLVGCIELAAHKRGGSGGSSPDTR